jgi:hypothetical protein
MNLDKVLSKETQPDLAVLAVESDVITVLLVRTDITHHSISLAHICPADEQDAKE